VKLDIRTKLDFEYRTGIQEAILRQKRERGDETVGYERKWQTCLYKLLKKGEDSIDVKVKGRKTGEIILKHIMKFRWNVFKIRILRIKKTLIPFSENISWGSEIIQKYPIILKCLPVFPLLQPYVKSIFFIHLTELLMD
jgi:hypothetical protein